MLFIDQQCGCMFSRATDIHAQVSRDLPDQRSGCQTLDRGHAALHGRGGQGDHRKF